MPPSAPDTDAWDAPLSAKSALHFIHQLRGVEHAPKHGKAFATNEAKPRSSTNMRYAGPADEHRLPDRRDLARAPHTHNACWRTCPRTRVEESRCRGVPQRRLGETFVIDLEGHFGDWFVSPCLETTARLGTSALRRAQTPLAQWSRRFWTLLQSDLRLPGHSPATTHQSRLQLTPNSRAPAATSPV